MLKARQWNVKANVSLVCEKVRNKDSSAHCTWSLVNQPQHSCSEEHSIRIQCEEIFLVYLLNPSRTSKPFTWGLGDERWVSNQLNKPLDPSFSVGSEVLTYFYLLCVSFSLAPLLLWLGSRSCYKLSDNIHFEYTLVLWFGPFSRHSIGYWLFDDSHWSANYTSILFFQRSLGRHAFFKSTLNLSKRSS